MHIFRCSHPVSLDTHAMSAWEQGRWLAVGGWQAVAAVRWEAADGADFGCGETGAEVGNGFFAVALGLGGYATAAHQNQIGRFGRDGARPSQVNDFVPGGTVVGFEVKGFGAVEAAAKCDKGDFHLHENYRRQKVRLIALKMKWTAMGARRVPVRT